MMLAEEEIRRGQGSLNRISLAVRKQSDLHRLGADPTRLKILYLLSKYKELCPSDIAAILKISISAVSHQLRILHSFSLIERTKKGKMICYTINKRGKKFLKVEI